MKWLLICKFNVRVDVIPGDDTLALLYWPIHRNFDVAVDVNVEDVVLFMCKQCLVFHVMVLLS